MRRIADALRLRAGGLTLREIVASLGVGRSTVGGDPKRCDLASLSWPLLEAVGDADLERRLFEPIAGEAWRGLVQPDSPAVHRSLKRKGVALALVWEHYSAAHPEDGYSYSRFCELYSRWEERLSLTISQNRFASERAFVDYAGDTLKVIDGTTGSLPQTQIFLGVLGTSNYTYVEATSTQALQDWIGAHVRTLAFFGGGPASWCPTTSRLA